MSFNILITLDLDYDYSRIQPAPTYLVIIQQRYFDIFTCNCICYERYKCRDENYAFATKTSNRNQDNLRKFYDKYQEIKHAIKNFINILKSAFKSSLFLVVFIQLRIEFCIKRN